MRIPLGLMTASVLFLGACSGVQDRSIAASELAPQRFVLQVALFPYIPERDSFAAWIEREFEAEHGDIDLVVMPMSEAESLDLSYNHDAAASALKNPDSGHGAHLIEIDTLTLGALVETGAIEPFSLDRKDFYSFAREAVTIDGRVYGVPHWTCGYFIITSSDDVARAGSADALRTALANLRTPHPDLGGDVVGSWGSVVSYLDAYVDTYPRGDLAPALAASTLDPRVAEALASVGAACTSSGTGLCNEDGDDIVEQFASGKLDALIGYSERLNVVFRQGGSPLPVDSIQITPAPLGVGKTAFLFTDALVKSAACTSRQCEDAARRFADFYISDAVMEQSMMGADGGAAAVPRYLLPATQGAMDSPRVVGDRIYQQLAPVLPTARPYPNEGVPEAKARGTIRTAVDALLNPS